MNEPALIIYGWDDKFTPAGRSSIQTYNSSVLDRCQQLINDYGVKFIRVYLIHMPGFPFWDWNKD